MPSAATTATPLHRYVELDEAYYSAYESYRPDARTLAEIKAIRPQAHIVVASRYRCPDCARNVPKMTRIAEHLPGWTWDIYSHDDQRDRSAELGIARIPTFIVYESKGGRELGRIVENPASGSLESDLFEILAAK